MLQSISLLWLCSLVKNVSPLSTISHCSYKWKTCTCICALVSCISMFISMDMQLFICLFIVLKIGRHPSLRVAYVDEREETTIDGKTEKVYYSVLVKGYEKRDEVQFKILILDTKQQCLLVISFCETSKG